jgi:PPP family 3-phenylpropionic acid transporter
VTGVKTLFFAYFSLVGAMSPYLGLYFAAWGLTITQISLLLAMPQLMRVVAPPFWGAWADRAAHRAGLLQVSAGGALLAIGLIAWAQGAYGWLLVLVSLLYFFTAAQGPIAESMALAAAGGDAGKYGRMRQWGSIGFIAAVSATGPLLDWLGARWLTVPMGALALLVLLVSWDVARGGRSRGAAVTGTAVADATGVDPGAPGRRVEGPAPQRQPSVWRRLREPRIALFFVSCGLMMFAHAALYAFFSLYLDRHGYAKTWIGAIWSLGVVAEIALFRWQSGLFERFGALPLLSFSMACAALRFALIGWGEGQWGIVLVSQLLHAITFGVHHSAAMALLHRWFEPAEQGRAQALFVTLGYGVGGSVGGLAAGWWWDHVGPAWAFYSAALAAALGWLAVAACRRFEYAAAAPDSRLVS